MKKSGTNTPENDEEEAVFEAWRARILKREEARTRRITGPRLERENSGIHFTPDTDLALSNGFWSPSGQRMKSRFLDY